MDPLSILPEVRSIYDTESISEEPLLRDQKLLIKSTPSTPVDNFWVLRPLPYNMIINRV